MKDCTHIQTLEIEKFHCVDCEDTAKKCNCIECMGVFCPVCEDILPISCDDLRNRCSKCNQVMFHSGEYPCEVCGRPLLWDEKVKEE